MGKLFNPTQGLLLRQVEAKLAPWRDLPRRPPPGGWLRVVRRAIGMSAAQLAHRLNISRQSLAALERREQDGTVTLQALSKAAASLDCDLVYALVPRSGLRTTVENRAKLQAAREIQNAAHTMRLEAQGVSQEETERLMQERALQLLSASPRKLWNEQTSERTASRGTRRRNPRG